MRSEKLLNMMESPEYKDMTCGEFAKIAREVQVQKIMEPVDPDGTEPYFEQHSNKESDTPLGSNPFMEG